MMKKIGVVFLFMLLITGVSAIEIQAPTTDYFRGGTFISDLQGDIINPIKNEDVGIFQEHVELPISVDLNIIDDVYYFSTVLPFAQGNYSLRISDVNYREFNQIKEETLEFNFTIGEQVADFAIDPGTIVATEDFEFNLINNLNQPLSINYLFLGDNITINLDPQENLNIPVENNDLKDSYIGNVVLQSDTGFGYIIPVYIIKNESSSSGGRNTTIDPDLDLSFTLQSIDAKINKDESYRYTTILRNTGVEDLFDIELAVSDEIFEYVTLSKDFISELKTNDEIIIEINIKFTETGIYSGGILARTFNISDEIDLIFDVGEDVNVTSSTPSNPDSGSCEALEGEQCTSNERCSGEGVFASDGFCCIGECIEKNQISNEESSINWWPVIIIFIILLLMALFFFLKTRKTKKTARDVLKDREKSFNEKYKTKGRLRNV